MTSVLNVDTIADKAGSGPVGLTKQSAAKVFCSWQKSSSDAINGSFNVTSQTDTATGHTTLAYINSMSAAGAYTAGGMSSDQMMMCANQGRTAAAGTALTTSSGAFSVVSDASVDKDSNVNLIAIHGDLA